MPCLLSAYPCGPDESKNLTSGIPAAKARKQPKEKHPASARTPPVQFTKATKRQVRSLRSDTDINPSGGCLISPHRNLITQLTTHQGGEIHLSLDACRKQALLLKGGSSDILEVYIHIYTQAHHFYRTVITAFPSWWPKEHIKQGPRLDTKALELAADGSITIQSMIAPREKE